MKKFEELIIVFLLGAVGYSGLEVLWRGYTHWTMAITGGICFLLLYTLNHKMAHAKLWKKCLVGSLVITTVEFTVGCIVNLMLGWNVWDYSRLGPNILGQVSLVYSLLWFLLCTPIMYLSDFLQKKFWEQH